MTGKDDAREAALLAAAAANDMKATDVMVQHVGPSIGVTDYFVFATVSNPRQEEAVIDRIEYDLREQLSMKPFDREMGKDGTWSLLDYGPVVIHVFSEEGRDFYRLEQLWSEAPIVDLESLEGFEGLEYSDRGRALLDSASSR